MKNMILKLSAHHWKLIQFVTENPSVAYIAGIGAVLLVDRIN